MDGKDSVSQETIGQLYSENIRQIWIDVDGKIVPEQKKGENDLPVYLFSQQDKIQAYIIPIHSRGLWGKISGYMAIKNDGTTISGFTVYSHQETPGLGGEIEKEWFRKNFEGKKILDAQDNFVSITITKGSVKGRIPESRRKNFVDGISGATMTGKFLSAGLRQTLTQYEPFSERFRKNELK
jgi:Na+-transporting NADH:ubiquinone oxidoreductase subunit C